jgi:hypothetical protein
MTMPYLTIVAHTKVPDATDLKVIRGLAQDRDAGIALSELAGATIAMRRMAMVLLSLFTALALALSAIGRDGVMFYAR